MKIGEFINKRRSALGLTLDDIGEAVGVGKSTVKKWETGFISNMKRDKIDSLAKILKVSPSVFIQEDIDYDEAVSLLPKEDTIFIMDDYKYFEVPRFESIAAGLGVIADSRPIGVDLLPFKSKSEAAETMTIKVSGDSMFPKIEDGDVIVVRKQTSVDSGTVAAVLIDGEDGVVKKVTYGDDWIELHSINPMYPVREFRGADVQRIQIVGRVMKIIKEM